MQIYLYFLYFIAIHITIILYYIFILFSNQSKHTIVSLKKTDGIKVLECFKKKLDINFQVEILNPKISETNSFRLLSHKLVVNSQFANISYLKNITLIAVSYLAGANTWIKNEVFVKNYLVLSYYLSILSTFGYFIFEDKITAILSIFSILSFTVIIIIDLIINSIHINQTLGYLIEYDLIDENSENSNVLKILNNWKVRNLDIYFRVVNDLISFFVRRVKQ